MSRTFIVILSLAAFAASSVFAQAPNPESKEEQQLLALVKDVQAQHAQIVGNQAKIETKLAEIAEAVRIARIYASRGGRK